ncbi:hypothetical protein [Catalinimonas niigatensis]|uniref:hypothetical protein n=1 Tax=Catalinimonas niigatensis TaxID=1397264 RepID=UPI002665B94A|nr:hypothetical protein [Catalinimonas niigatensis]WPP53437.1 hypothetical protein PZB72_13760 [Catalinimonas niigatensis]
MLLNRRISKGEKKVILHHNTLEIYQGDDHLKDIRNLSNILSISYRYDNLTIQYNDHQDEEGERIIESCIIYNVDEFIVRNAVEAEV